MDALCGSVSGRRHRLDGGERWPLPSLDRLDQIAADTERLVDPVLDLLRNLRVFIEERLGVATALPEPLLAVGEERARLRDDVVLDPVVDQAARGRDPLAALDVELGLLERRRHL